MIAKGLLRIARRCLGSGRSDWANAMDAELEHARRDGRSIPFAFGCLVASARHLPRHAEGRYALASHALSIGILVPVAALQLACAVGFVRLSVGHDGLYAALSPGAAHRAYLDEAYRSARPVLLAICLLLGVAQWRLAWAMLDRAWAHVFENASLILAASISLTIFTGVLVLDPTAAILQVSISIIQLVAVFGAACWHRRLSILH